MKTAAFVLSMFVMMAAPRVEAQVQVRPTDPPAVTAANESWYILREPIQFAGELYYPAGAAVFFNGYTMVPSGHYNGVPLYNDTTVEPFSVVLVPIGQGLMQPYERPRRGDLAGTTGSRPPSFPVEAVPGARGVLVAPVAPTRPPMAAGAIGVFTPAGPATSTPAAPAPDVVGTTGAPGPVTATPGTVATLLRPENNDGIWVTFEGERWISAGAAVPFAPEAFLVVGQHAGRPVYARRGLDEDVIYLATAAGLVAPFRLKDTR